MSAEMCHESVSAEGQTVIIRSNERHQPPFPPESPTKTEKHWKSDRI